jgi:hypothetical protein
MSSPGRWTPFCFGIASRGGGCGTEFHFPERPAKLAALLNDDKPSCRILHAVQDRAIIVGNAAVHAASFRYTVFPIVSRATLAR